MRTPHLLRDRAQAYVAPRAAGIALFVIIALGLLAGRPERPAGHGRGRPGWPRPAGARRATPRARSRRRGHSRRGSGGPARRSRRDSRSAPSPPASRPAPIRRPFLPRSPRRRRVPSRTSPETGPRSRRPRSLRSSPPPVEEPAPPVEPPPPVETPPDEIDRQPADRRPGTRRGIRRTLPESQPGLPRPADRRARTAVAEPLHPGRELTEPSVGGTLTRGPCVWPCPTAPALGGAAGTLATAAASCPRPRRPPRAASPPWARPRAAGTAA